VHLHKLANKQLLTLLTATKDVDISEAAVLADLIATNPATANWAGWHPETTAVPHTGLSVCGQGYLAHS
jgi:hypothetical protein